MGRMRTALATISVGAMLATGHAAQAQGAAVPSQAATGAGLPGSATPGSMLTWSGSLSGMISFGARGFSGFVAEPPDSGLVLCGFWGRESFWPLSPFC